MQIKDLHQFICLESCVAMNRKKQALSSRIPPDAGCRLTGDLCCTHADLRGDCDRTKWHRT